MEGRGGVSRDRTGTKLGSLSVVGDPFPDGTGEGFREPVCVTPYLGPRVRFGVGTGRQDKIPESILVEWRVRDKIRGIVWVFPWTTTTLVIGVFTYESRYGDVFEGLVLISPRPRTWVRLSKFSGSGIGGPESWTFWVSLPECPSSSFHLRPGPEEGLRG